MRTYILNPFPINLFKPLWKRITITLAFRESTNVVLSRLNAPKHYLCKGEKTSVFREKNNTLEKQGN